MTLLKPVFIGVLFTAATLSPGGTAFAQPAQKSSSIQTVTMARPDSPLVALKVQIRAGSIHDPKGQEGLAAVTGLMVGQAATKRHSYPQLLESLYPMAAGINVSTDREVTVFSGRSHKETLEGYTALFTEVLLEPAFT